MAEVAVLLNSVSSVPQLKRLPWSGGDVTVPGGQNVFELKRESANTSMDDLQNSHMNV